MIVQIALDSSFEGSVESFYLTVRLRMIRRRELVTNIQNSANVLKELACKVFSVIRQYMSRRSINENPFINEGFGQIGC